MQLGQGLIQRNVSKLRSLCVEILFAPKNAKPLHRYFSFFVILFTVVLTYFAKDLRTHYSMEQFFPKNHPLLQNDSKIKKLFNISSKPVLALLIEMPGEHGSWLMPTRITQLKALTNELKTIQSVKSVFSMTEIQTSLEKDGQLLVGPVFDLLDAEQFTNYVSTSTIIQPHLITADKKATLLLIDLEALDPYRLKQKISEIETKALMQFPDLSVSSGGPLAIQSQLTVMLMNELGKFFLLSVLIFALITKLFFKDNGTLWFLLGSLVMTNLVVVGLLGFFEIPFTVLLSTLPILVSLTVVSLIVHTLHSWAFVEKQKDFVLSWQNLLMTLKDLFLPNMLGSLTTSIGFLSLAWTAIPLINQFGLVISIVIMFVWLYSLFLIIVWGPYLKPQLRDFTQSKAYWVMSLRRKSVWGFSLTVFAFVFFLLSGRNLNFSTKLFNDLPENHQARASTEFIDSKFGGSVYYDVVLELTGAGNWKSSQSLGSLNKTVEQIRALAGVGSALSVVDILGPKSLQTDQKISETLFLFSMSSPNPTESFLADNDRITRVSIRLFDLESDRISELRSAITSRFKSQFPKVKITEAGMAATIHTINSEVSKDLIFGFWQSLLIIFVMLIFIFKSIRWAIVACIPNLIPPAILIGSLGLMETPIKPGIALIFSISLGLAFNNTVYLLGRLKSLTEGRNFLPVKRAFFVEANPCLFATVVVFCGFSVFLASDFELNRSFGIYMLISIFAGAIGDLIFLPVLLTHFPDMLNKSDNKKFNSENNQKDRDSMSSNKIAASFVLFLLICSVPHQVLSATADQRAKDLLIKASQQLQSKDEVAKVKMKIIETDGSVKVRTMSLQTLSDKSFFAKVKMLEPADIKGTAFLAEVTTDRQNQWVYLPSSRQIRKIVTSNTSQAGILGSEVTADDLNLDVIKSSVVKLRAENAQAYIFSVQPKKKSKYQYSYLYLSKANLLPIKIDHYVGQKIAKTVEFSNYKKLAGGTYRSQLIRVKNNISKRSTDLEISDISVNGGLSKSDFVPDSLKYD